MSIPDFLKALQAAKKDLLKPERPEVEHRAKALESAAQTINAKQTELVALDPAAILFSESFYLEQVITPSIHAFQRAARESSSATFPVGLLSVRLDSAFFLRLLCERAAPALMAGNNILLAVTAAQKPLADQVAQILVQAGFAPESLQVLIEDVDTRPLLLQHPGIRGISWFAPQLQAKDLGAETWFDKKWQLHRGGKSVAMILADADLDQAVAGIIHSIRQGLGTLSWNISRVIAVESIEKEFQEKLKTALAKENVQLPADIQENRDRWASKFKSQQARELQPGHPLAFLINVSNCSEEHQLELRAPVVFIQSVKYPHEMQKWLLQLPNPLAAQIWGGDEKIQKLAPKLEVGRIWVRGWLEQDQNLFYGVKSSIFGSTDGRAFGDFFSDHRKVDV